MMKSLSDYYLHMQEISMNPIKNVLKTAFQQIWKICLKWYWYILGAVLLVFVVNFFGGIVYGIVNKDIVEERTYYLEQRAIGLAEPFHGRATYFGHVNKLPALFLTVCFDDGDELFLFDSFLSDLQEQGWTVYSCNERLRTARLYNEEFIIDIDHVENKKQVIISIVYNDIWTRMKWLEYLFVPGY